MNVKCATSLFFRLSDCGKDYAPNVKANHNDSFQAVNCLSCKGKYKAEDADGGQYDQIINGGGIYPDGVYCRRYSKDKEQVENIGADYISHCKPGLSLFGGNHRSGQFWQRGADGNHCQPD